jgi:hypothetical protein
VTSCGVVWRRVASCGVVWHRVASCGVVARSVVWRGYVAVCGEVVCVACGACAVWHMRACAGVRAWWCVARGACVGYGTSVYVYVYVWVCGDGWGGMWVVRKSRKKMYQCKREGR